MSRDKRCAHVDKLLCWSNLIDMGRVGGFVYMCVDGRSDNNVAKQKNVEILGELGTKVCL